MGTIYLKYYLNYIIMNVGDIKYFKIIQSLGKLKGCEIKEKDVASSKFGMRLTKTSHSVEYGTWDYYQIELFNNGNYSDIQIGTNAYSYMIKSYTSWFSTYQEWHNKYTIEYSNGKEIRVFEYDSPSRTHADGLCDIVYILILLSEIDNIDKVNAIYTFIFKPDCVSKSLGERIDLFREIKDIVEKIKDKYPFIYHPISNGLQKRLNEIKSDLLKEALIENNL